MDLPQKSGTQYLTGAVHNFVNHFDPKKDCMNILENEGVPAGCIAITHVDTATAQLRFFFLEPEMRGRGDGHRLMNVAIDFCREKRMSGVLVDIQYPHGCTTPV
jgi:N-acetylglutamate synthase-like GNAT family acetyltransferase